MQYSLDFGQQPRRDLYYFALRPDGSAAREAVELALRFRGRYRLAGRPYDISRLHVSLCLAMSRRGPRKGDVAAALHAAGRIKTETFDIGFDRLCTFGGTNRRAIVLCCGSGESQVKHLHRQLAGELSKSGLGSQRTGFTPHLTLLWDRLQVPEVRLDRPVCWTVAEFVLVQSQIGRSRQIDVERWPLRLLQS